MSLSSLLKRANMEAASWPHCGHYKRDVRLQGPSFFKCLSLSPFSAVDPDIMLASRILSELSGVDDLIMSKAARRDKDQLGTTGHMRSLQLKLQSTIINDDSLQPKLQTFSTSGARPVIWRKCVLDNLVIQQFVYYTTRSSCDSLFKHQKQQSSGVLYFCWFPQPSISVV